MANGPPTSRPLWRALHPVWGLSALVATCAAALLMAERGMPAILQPHVAWWLLALGFALAERCVVHLHFQRHAHSFSLGDIPLVFGLLFCTPAEFVAAMLTGSALVLTLDRRLPPIKVAFNLAQFALTATVSVLVLQLLVDPADRLDPATAAAVLLAVQVSAIAGVALISAAISLSETRIALPTLGDMFGMDFVVTATNSSVGLLAALVLTTEPWGLVLILIPVATVFSVYRAYLRARQRHDRLEFLYEANRTLSRNPEAAEAFQALLEKSLEAFRAESAELILYSAERVPLRMYLSSAGDRETMRPIEPELAQSLRAFAAGPRPVRMFDGATGDAVLNAYLVERGITHGMVAVLGTDDRAIGTLMLANRSGVVQAFSGDDLDLFETLAGNAGAALQNERLEQTIGELRLLKDQLDHQAHHDPLTSLPNRLLFHSGVRAALRRGTGDVAVLFIDVDDFKTVNDGLGHAVGDELLRGVADRLKDCVRRDDIVARLGGDEFAVLHIDPLDARAAAEGLARRIIAAFQLPIAAGDELVSVHLSLGIAVAAGPGVDEDELIRHADIAMYQAKAAGKGRFELFDPAAGDAMLTRHALKEELSQAIARGELEVHYQPIVRARDGRVVAAEALLRWRHPSRGLVLPGEFIALSEETGLIVSFGRLVLERACEQAATWRAGAASGEGIAAHVNISPIAIQDPGLCDAVHAALQRSGLPPHALVLEITESRLLHDESCVETLKRLRAMGVRLALDDFGTGYSSLAYLRDLPIDVLKIPKPFIDRLSEGDDVVVRAICQLADELELDVVAEGVESREQLEALARHERVLVQGFYLGRPSPADAFDLVAPWPPVAAA